MQIALGFLGLVLLCWLVGWGFFSLGIAWVRLADKFHQLTKGKWQ